MTEVWIEFERLGSEKQHKETLFLISANKQKAENHDQLG